jgi:hypothetical protein
MAAYFRLIIKTAEVISFAESPNHLRHCSNQMNIQKARESDEESL